MRIGIEVQIGVVVEVPVRGHADAPLRAEQVDRLGEDVVVDEARVDAEERHEQDDVAAAEEVLDDLVALERLLEVRLALDHEQRREEHDEAVANVAEHHGEQERKRDDHERRRIDLAIARHTVRVHDVLEADGELVVLVIGGRRARRRHVVQNGLKVRVHFFLSSKDKTLYFSINCR